MSIRRLVWFSFDVRIIRIFKFCLRILYVDIIPMPNRWQKLGLSWTSLNCFVLTHYTISRWNISTIKTVHNSIGLEQHFHVQKRYLTKASSVLYSKAPYSQLMFSTKTPPALLYASVPTLEESYKHACWNSENDTTTSENRTSRRRYTKLQLMSLLNSGWGYLE